MRMKTCKLDTNSKGLEASAPVRVGLKCRRRIWNVGGVLLVVASGGVRVAAQVEVAAVVAHLADHLAQRTRGARRAPLRRVAELAHADQAQQVAPEQHHLCVTG